jgi:Acyl-CoA carboxylase epsilon subunit
MNTPLRVERGGACAEEIAAVVTALGALIQRQTAGSAGSDGSAGAELNGYEHWRRRRLAALYPGGGAAGVCSMKSATAVANRNG